MHRSPIAQLCRLNLFFYIAEVALMFDAVVTCLYSGASGLAAVAAFDLFVLPFFWVAFRATIGQQLRLTRNAARVLQIMTSAASKTRSARAPHTKPQEEVLRDLPWLPAHDRRDT